MLMTLIWLDNNGHISNLRSLAFVYYYGVQSRTYGWITKPKEGRGRIRRSMLGGGGVSLDYGALGRAGPWLRNPNRLQNPSKGRASITQP